MKRFNIFTRPLSLSLLSILTAAVGTLAGDADEKPIKGLIITGGCCHNYPFQAQAMTEGISKKASVEWTVVNKGGGGTRAEIDLYADPKWAAGFDVVIHNECFADTTNPEYIRKITQPHHDGVPALVIHCAMHTYRAAEIDDWRQFLGVTSRHHEHQSEYPVKKVVADHPILKDMPDDWVTPKDELYIVHKIWPTAKPLAVSKSERSGEEQPVFWINQYGNARVFGTTYGHSDATFRDPVFINVLANGVLWATGRLE